MINIKFINDIKINVPKNKFETNITYPIVEPFSYARIYFDRSTYDLIYEIIEPELTENEEKIYRNIIFYIEKLLYIKLSEINNLNDAINYLQRLYDFVLNDLGIKLGQSSYEKIFYYIFRDLYGYNKVDSLLRDPLIEDIECSGPNYPIFIVHRYFGNLKTNIILSDKEIRDLIEKFALRAGKHISYAEPILDATLPDGSRLNATYSQEITTNGPTFTIRKFKKQMLSLVDLIKSNMLDSEIAAYLWTLVEYRANILIAGSTSSGKTTLLNSIAQFIPPESKVISIEDTRELQLYHENWIPATIRKGFFVGDKYYGEIDMYRLLSESFRQNPDYVIVGEVRGEETYVMFQGMASGHSALSTIHTDSWRALIRRLTTAPINLTLDHVALLDAVIFTMRARNVSPSARRIREIVEVGKYLNGKIENETAVKWNFEDDTFEKKDLGKYTEETLKYRVGSNISFKDSIEEKKQVIDYLVNKNIRENKKITEYIKLYYTDKDSLLKKI